MSTILITGLDGSGKSTVFERLSRKRSFGIVQVPQFSIDFLPENFIWKETCIQLNKMGTIADESGDPLLKILTLFSAICLVPVLEEALLNSGKNPVFAERHPLIDAPVYVKAYKTYLQPEKWSKQHVKMIDDQFGQVLNEIAEFMQVSIQTASVSYELLQFIATLFDEKTNAKKALQTVFNCRLPDKIYFLDAPADVLIKRIEARNVKEFHENEATLNLLRTAYMELFDSLSNVEVIDASSFENLDLFVTGLCAE